MQERSIGRPSAGTAGWPRWRALSCALILAVLCGIGDAQAAQRCEIGGFLRDREHPTPLRAAPHADAAVLAMLPGDADGDYAWAVGASVIEARDGWLRLQDVSYDPDPVPEGGVALPVLEGWIRNDQFDLIVQGVRGRAGPARDTTVVDDLQGRWLSEVGRIERITGCEGRWVELVYRRVSPAWLHDAGDGADAAVPRRAWFTDVCNIQETSCDMASNDP